MSDVHLELDLDFDGGSNDGRLREDDGSVRRFHGWLGLVDALERLRPGGRPNPTTTRPDADSTALKTFMLIHRHSLAECRVAHAAWSGFDSPLRGRPVPSTCACHQPLQSARDARRRGQRTRSGGPRTQWVPYRRWRSSRRTSPSAPMPEGQ